MYDWVREHRFESGLAAAAIVAVAIGALRGNEPATDAPVTSTTLVSAATTATAPSAADRPEVPPISCESLFTAEERDLALGVADRSGADRGSFLVSRGEVCTERLSVDESYFLFIGPADPADFAPGATLRGAVGEAVDGVGGAARWFGGVGTDDGGSSGVLSVYAESQVGDLVFRVAVGRPDLAPDAQRDLAVYLAGAALPRFPYVEAAPAEPSDPVVISFEREEPAADPPTLDDVLLAGEASGEWSRGAGLVAALGFLAGESTGFEAPAQLDWTNGSSTGVLLLAHEYLGSGTDSASRAEIERLLGLLSFPTPAGDEPTAVDTSRIVGFVPELTAQVEPGPCGLDADWYGIDCMTVEQLGPVRFGYPGGAIEGEVAGWDAGDIERTRAAITTAVTEFEKHGVMPPTDLWFTPHGGSFGNGVPSRDEERCLVARNTAVQAIDDDANAFVVGMDLAGCLLFGTLPREVLTSYGASKWWFQGLVVYFSAEAFAEANVEWQELPDRLSAKELHSSLQDRSVENFMFFRSVGNRSGNPATVLDLIRPLTDAATKAAQQEKLAAHGSSRQALHVFHQELTDEAIGDVNGTVPYSPLSFPVEISQPTIVIDEAVRFGVTRYHVTVAADTYACLEYDNSDALQASWRDGVPGPGGGSWTFDLPEEITGESVFVVTTVEEDQRFIASAKVSDEPGCDEEEEDDVGEVELPDCGFCDPSFFYRFLGTILDIIGA